MQTLQAPLTVMVESALEHRTPDIVFDQIIIHHESLLMEQLENIAVLFGGTTHGPWTKHRESFIDHSQFEVDTKGDQHA